jgi:ABC-type enterochelin transport system permease subunit
MKPLWRTNIFVSLGLHILGFLLCILPPAICTLSYFPLWREAGYESCIAGGVAILLILCALPIYKLIKRMLTSYSSYFLWLVLFLLFFALSRIADQMTVISLVGFIGNLLGAICFFIAKRLNKIRKSEED